MYRTKHCLSFVAGLVALASLPLIPPPARGADANPSAWRFRPYRAPAEPVTVTVSGPRGHGWFDARDASGHTVRISLPPKFGSVERDGKLVATEALHAGDAVQVWGVPSGGRLDVARAHVVTGETTAARHLQTVSAGCCGACASCTHCGSSCADCKSRTDCGTCCGAACCPSRSCCA
jgi:hypothetical protein